MDKPKVPSGIEQLVDKYRTIFHVPENLKYYSKDDFIIAEKKFIKYALMEGKIKIK
jgi:hypothetical protein